MSSQPSLDDSVLTIDPSICLAIQACVLSPGFDFRLNRHPVSQVKASGSLEAPGRRKGACGNGFIPGRVQCFGVRSG